MKQKLFAAVASCGHVPELAGGVPITGRTVKHVEELLRWRFPKNVPDGMSIVELKPVKSNG